MAEGIVTDSDAQFREILAASAPEVAAVAWRARELVFDVLPDAVEVVWLTQRSAGYGFGPRKMRDQFVWLLPFARHVAMAFPFGTELDDPDGLLQGTGAKVRNVRLETPDDVARPALRSLLERALAERRPHAHP